jgi:alpha-amylase
VRPQVLLQGFYKRGKYIAAPSPADPNDPPSTDWWWDHLAKQAAEIAHAGITGIWLPPVTKAMQGVGEAALGYSVYDDYDIGSKNQKGALHTRYGDRTQLARCCAMLRANGLDVLLDLQLNHRKGGAGPDGMDFQYPDAYGNAGGGRFPKNRFCFHSRYPADPVPSDFHPEIPQDPNVPDGIWELQEGSNVYFGPDLAHINGQPPGYVSSNVIANVDWLTRALDAQGYRIDHVQGISADFLKGLLASGSMAGKFAVGEFWDGVTDHIANWLSEPRWMKGRCSAFDFPLYFTLLGMANDPHFDMTRLDHAGLAGRDPFHAVTFVENHDTESRRDLVPRNIQPEDKPLAYAYILTSEGLPCVFIKDFLDEPGCLGSRLKSVLKNLIWIRQNIAEGATLQRWKDPGVFVYERTGGARLLVGLNKDKHHPRTLPNVLVGFPPGTRLHDYSGHANDVSVDANGRVTIDLPANEGGLGYVCYSVAGLGGAFQIAPASVTQEFAGAHDLDIKPAETGAPIQAARIWVAANEPITAMLTYDDRGWTPATKIDLTLLGPDGQKITDASRGIGQSGAPLASAATTEGWYIFKVESFAMPAGAAPPSYTLRVTYRAPKQATF